MIAAAGVGTVAADEDRLGTQATGKVGAGFPAVPWIQWAPEVDAVHGMDASTDSIARVENDDRHAAPRERVGGGKPGSPGAHHRHPLTRPHSV